MAPKAKPPAPETAEKPAEKGERIAKVLSRRGIASRREAERLIEAGEVSVNGRVIDSPALNVTAKDRITVSGQPLPDREPARLWLYYKPEGLVTSAADEKGRDTVFDHLPEDMPRVMSVGRLDLNSEGLLLLTNDGELKRRLELPSTGWLRKYRVRVNGNPTDPDLEPLRRGITVEGERFQPMQVTLDRIQGANAWLTVGLREGKNREIRRAMNAIDLYVNRLIRVSYGPFRLGDLQPGQVEEVRPKVLREQLGEATAEDAAEGRAGGRARAKPAAAPRRSPEKPAAAPRRTAGKPATAPARRDEDTPATGRRFRPGEGVKELSRAWKEAVTPDEKPGPRGKAPSTRSRTAAPKTTEPAAPRADRSRPAAPPRKPGSTAAPARPGRPAPGGDKPKPPSGSRPRRRS